MILRLMPQLKGVTVMSENYDPVFPKEDMEKNKALVAVSCIPILFFLPLVVAPTSGFGRFYSNQSLLVLLIIMAARVIAVLPLIGFVGNLLSFIALIAFLYNIVMVIMGTPKRLPLIGTIDIIK